MFSRGPHFPAGLPYPQKQSAQGRPGDLGPGRGARPRFHARWSGPVSRDPCPRTGSLVQTQAWAPPRQLRVLLWLKLPHPAPRQQTSTQRLQLSKVWAKLHEKGVSPLRPRSPRAQTPLSMKASEASCPWCPLKAFTCSEPHPTEQDQAPWQEPGEATGATGARARIFPGALLWPRHPLSPGAFPHCPLNLAVHLHPNISSCWPPCGSDTGGRGARNWPRWWQTRRPLCPIATIAKIPLFFHLKRGPPLQVEEQGGGPQEMASVQVAAGWFRAKTWGGQAQGRPPPTTSLPGATCPTLEISGQVHRVPGLGWGELEVLPATQRTERFPVDATSQQVSHRRRGRVPREDLGTWGRGGGPAKLPCQVEQARRRGTNANGWVLPWGHLLRPSCAAKSIAFAQTAPPCREAANLDPAPSTR